jgi:hypothetical protein
VKPDARGSVAALIPYRVLWKDTLLVLQCALYRDYNENYNQYRKEELHTKKETECPENKETDILTIRGVIADGDLQLVWMYLIHTGNLFLYSYMLKVKLK